MAKVSLRIYNNEIENLVERGQLDEAIAHCRHVLNTFPKNLETYRLIGKSYLEAKRYNEATDIFERLLMAVPDDFVAHVGMSIIRDEQKEMDAAIWHMQRAFEVQPSNAAIQAELQRLYGRRDGVEPPKIRLTRGALAHMYVQGELYPQAISEITSVLEEDQERHDMQVLLARAYFHSGNKNESAEICSQLLRRYPYCLDANRVLVELLPETEHGESVQTYRKRVNEMDPYAAYATGSVFHTDEVSDASVGLERLEWDGQSVDMGPEWGESQGISRDQDTAGSDEEPDWLKAALTPETPGAPTSTASPPPGEEPAPVSDSLPAPTANGGEDEIPEFLREAGWGEDTGTFQEGASPLDDSAGRTTEEPAIAEGDLPDWVKAMAPTGADVENEPAQAEPSEDLTQDDVPDWLQGLGDAQDVQSAPSDEQPLAAGEDMPDWLESARPVEAAESQPEEQAETTASSDDDALDFLQSLQSEEEQPEAQEIPQEPAQETLAVQEAPRESVHEIPAAEDAPLSDWQLDDEAPAAPVDDDKTDTGSLGASAEEKDDAIAWLEGLASKHGAKPEELVTDPEARKETEPDWVQQAKSVQEQDSVEPVTDEQPPAVVEEPEQETTGAVDIPDIPTEEQAVPMEEPEAKFDTVDTGELGASTQEQDDAVAWLEGLASKHGAKPEELVTDPNARTETAPDWVQKATEVGEDQPSAEEPEPQPSDEESAPQAPFDEEPVPSTDADETGVWLQELGEDGGIADNQAAQPESKGDFTTWLDGLDSEEVEPGTPTETESALEAEKAPNEEAAPEPAGEAEPESPDWLRSIESEQPETPAEEVSAEDLPSWLDGLDGDASETPAEPAAPASDDLPDWLRAEADKADEPVQPEPTAPADWKPEDVAEEPPPVEPPAPAPVAEESQPAPKPVIQEPAQAPVEPEPESESTAPVGWKPEDVAEEPAPVEPPAPTPVAEEQPAPEPPHPAPVEAKPEPELQPEREAFQDPVTRSRSGMTGILSATQDPLLVEAQNELTRSNIPAAMENYGKLIKKGKMLDEVIFDLREALYRFPVEVAILQTLGDAYMRANRLQDALDSYTKAEELLR